MRMRKITVHEEALTDGCEDEAGSGHVPDHKVSNIDIEAKMDIMIRIVKMLFFVVFVGVAVGIMYALK